MVTALNLLIACSKDQIEEIEIAPTANTHDALTTRAVNATSWDQCDYCVTSSNLRVALPWATTMIGSIPTDVRKDVKKTDGWDLLYSNVNIQGYEHEVDTQPGANYILLYNHYTGVLKGFYYAATIQENNNAYWELTVPEENTK